MMKTWTLFTLLVCSSALAVSNDDGYVFQSDTIDLTLPSLGNGYMATIVNSNSIYLAGVFNAKQPNDDWPDVLVSNRASLQNPHLQIIPDSVDKDIIYSMNVREGSWKESYTIVGAEIEKRVYIHRDFQYRGCFVTEFVIVNDNDNDLSIDLLTSHDLNDPSSWLQSEDFAFTNNDEESFVGVTHVAENTTNHLFEVAAAYTAVPPQISVKANSKENFRFVVSFAQNLTDVDEDPLAFAKTQLDAAMSDTDLYEKHVQRWENLWSSSSGGGSVDVKVNSDDNKLNEVIHSSIYSILTSVRSELPFGLSPGGLSTNGYEGHTFWDQETWMVPPMLAISEKALSESILVYRENTMEGAKAKAVDNDFEGVMFAWESCISGHEEYWFGDCGQLEHHITSDVVNAFQQRYYAYRDDEWLERVSELIFGAATFWTSRASVCEGDDSRLCIVDVMGPDEYHFPIDNSAYVIVTAQSVLTFASDVCELYLSGDKCNGESDVWRRTASKLSGSIPFDSELSYHLEFEGYDAGVEVKQADTILLYSFPFSFNDTSYIKNDLDYYRNNTDENGPAMTWSAFSMAYLRGLSDEETAAELFVKGYQTVQERFYVWAETIGGGCGNFITGAGGFLQSVIYGYGGITYREDRLEVKTLLPNDVSEMTMDGVKYRDCVLKIEGNVDGIVVTLVSGGGVNIAVEGEEEVIELTNAGDESDRSKISLGELYTIRTITER